MVNGSSTVPAIGALRQRVGRQRPSPRRPRGALARRGAAGSDTVMSVTPCERSTAVVRSPTGPPPVTSTRSSGVAPERATVCSAIAVGSVERGRPGRQPVGDAQQTRRGHRLVPAERAAEPEVVGRLAPQAHRGSAAHTRSALAAARRRVGDDPRPELPPVDARRRARRPCPPTRDRAPHRGVRTAPGRGAGRSRRCRSATPRSRPRRGPGPGGRAPAPRSRRHRCRRRPASDP